jgi:hypothetical protein
VKTGIARARPAKPRSDSGTTMLGGTTRVSATPATPSYSIEGAPPVLCVRVTFKHIDPPAGIDNEAWLALVLTVKGLVVCAPVVPKVVVQVVPAFGIVFATPRQLAVLETPTATVTVSLMLPVPPLQYIVKVQVPAETV